MFLTQLPGEAQRLASALPPLSANAVTVLDKRYLDKDTTTGELTEDADGMLWRTAHHLAKAQYNYGATDTEVLAKAIQYYALMRGRRWLPNSPTLANAGTRTGQLSACFVLPVPDDLAGIFMAIRFQALIHQTGGGTGFSFSLLRSQNMIVNSTRGVSSGPLSFMDVFNAATESIKQGGVRRGANMGIIRIDHPDIVSNPEIKDHVGFVQYKQDLSKLTNFNVSVAVTDVFLEALERGKKGGDDSYELIDPKYGPTGRFLSATKVWREIAERAHGTGEPGLFFINRANKYNPVPLLGKYDATNPCGEQPLIPYESCNLGSMTLDTYFRHLGDTRITQSAGVVFTSHGTFDVEEFDQDVYTAIEAMDDVVDMNEYVPAVPQIKEITLQTRKLGLGEMGLARLLFKLRVPYDSLQGREIAGYIYARMDVAAHEKSVELAKKRGPYPYFKEHWDESVAFHIHKLTERAEKAREMGWYDLANRYAAVAGSVAKHGLRNSTLTTVAPTGTLSIIHDTSGGCEPVFALAFKRNQAGVLMTDSDPVFHDALVYSGFNKEQVTRIEAAVEKHSGSLLNALDKDLYDGLTVDELDILNKLSRIFVTAGDISPADHVYTQAALQPFCDSAISKTINMPESSTVEDVEEAYDLAVTRGCKGITVYRNNCRQFQPLSTTTTEKPKVEVNGDGAITLNGSVSTDKHFGDIEVHMDKAKPRPREEQLFGYSKRVETGEGRVYLDVNYDKEGIREVFAVIGHGGGVLFGMVEAIGRLISLALQYRIPVKEIAKQLRGIRGPSPYGFGPNQILSIPDAIGKELDAAPKTLTDALAPEGYVDRYGMPNHPAYDILELGTPALREVAEAEASEVNGTVDHVTKRSEALKMGESPECPQCGSPMFFGEGCRGGTCSDPGCGYAKC